MPVNYGSRSGYSDDELAIRTIMGEESVSDPTGQLGVANVILNRANNPAFGWSNIASPSQFNGFDSVSPVGSPAYNSAAQAWQTAKSGVDITGGALFYANPAYSSASWPSQLQSSGTGLTIGQQVFSDQLGPASVNYSMSGQSMDATAPLGTYSGGSSGIASQGNVNNDFSQLSNYPPSQGSYPYAPDDMLQAQYQSQGTYSVGATGNDPLMTFPGQTNSSAFGQTLTGQDDGLSSGTSSSGLTTSVSPGDATTDSQSVTTASGASGPSAQWATQGVAATVTSGNTIASGIGNAVTSAANALTGTQQSLFSGWAENIQKWFVNSGILLLGIVLIIMAILWVMRSSQTTLQTA
jgi:hypothetical protein